MSNARQPRAWPSVVFVVAASTTSALFGCSAQHGGAALADAGADATMISTLPRDALLDPVTCQGCHPSHYADWSRSMHAYSSDDPIFVAMNQRGQRETGGTLGDFCVKCHAPMALRDGKTTDGTNLAGVDRKYKGVTCFFCHNVASIAGSHNAALNLSDDVAMRGEYSSTLPNGAHTTAYSSLHDRDQQDSAKMCGACHDIVVTQTNTPIERTFCEWSHSAFNAAGQQGGETCVQCHMVESNGAIAQVPNAPVRRYHTHDFPGVDIALGPSLGDAGAEKASAQQFLATSLQGALCVTQLASLRVILDPVALGHNWPSGAAQDRRAWAEVIAYSGGNVIYQSGVVPDGTAVVDVQNDPDLWLLRDQMYDTQNNPVSMFWQAASTKGNAIPGLSSFDQTDPMSGYWRSHVVQFYPRNGGVTPMSLPQMPDRVTLRMRLQPVGLDVLNDLVDSGDLDPNVAGNMPTYDVSFLGADGGLEPLLEWTPQAASFPYQDEFDRTLTTCVATGLTPGATKVIAPALAVPADCLDAGADDASAQEDASDGAAAPDADAAVECDPRLPMDTLASGLTKLGSGGALTFVLVSADPLPPGIAYNTWVVKVLDTKGKPVTDAMFTTIKPWMPLHGHGSSVVSTSTSNGDGTYALRVYLLMPGFWQVTLTVQTGSTTDTVVFSFCVGG